MRERVRLSCLVSCKIDPELPVRASVKLSLFILSSFFASGPVKTMRCFWWDVVIFLNIWQELLFWVDSIERFYFSSLSAIFRFSQINIENFCHLKGFQYVLPGIWRRGKIDFATSKGAEHFPQYSQIKGFTKAQRNIISVWWNKHFFGK
jgi:hypothetical protein